MEWRFNQFLGEKLTYQQIKEDPENESFLVTDIKFSGDGENVVVSENVSSKIRILFLISSTRKRFSYSQKLWIFRRNKRIINFTNRKL